MGFKDGSKPRIGAGDAIVEIRDYSLWIKHIKGNEELRNTLGSLGPGQLVHLSVGGYKGVWQKKENGANGLPTQGLKPLGEMRERWFRWFKERRGEMVKIGLDEEVVRTGADRTRRARIPLEYPTATKAEQEAAWAALQRDMNAGWRSEEPYGPRDELYER